MGSISGQVEAEGRNKQANKQTIKRNGASLNENWDEKTNKKQQEKEKK